VIAVAATGCGKDTPTTPTPPAASFANIQSTILTPACESCHTDVGRNPAGGLNLKMGTSYSQLVNQASVASPKFVRRID
jgi:hypothetical protein